MKDMDERDARARTLLRDVAGEARLDDVGFERLARRVRAEADAAWHGRGVRAGDARAPSVRRAALFVPLAVAAAAVVVALGWSGGTAPAVPAVPSGATPGSAAVTVFGVRAPENTGLLATVSGQSTDDEYLDALLGTANRTNLLVASVGP